MTSLQRETLTALVALAVAHTVENTAERHSLGWWTAEQVAGRMGHREHIVASTLGKLAQLGYVRKGRPIGRPNPPVWRPTAIGIHEILRSHPPLGG